MIGTRVALFFACFLVLIAPWPGLDAAYGAWTRVLGSSVLSWGSEGERIRFETIQRSQYRPLDTRIVLTKSRLRGADGRPRAALLDLDMRGIGWVPTAFFAALVLATPVPWARRGRALAWGLVAMQAFVLLSIGVHILDYSDAGGGAFLAGLDETLINQLSPGFFAAALVWLAVTIRREDWAALGERRMPAPSPNSGLGRYAEVTSPSRTPISIEARGAGLHRRPAMTNSPPEPARSFRLLHFQSTAVFGGDESNSLLLCRHLPGVSHRIAVYYGSGPMEATWSAAGAEVALLRLAPADRGGLIRAVRKTVSAVCPDGVFLSSVSLLPLVLKGLDGYGGEVLCHTGNPDASSLSTRLKFWTARAWLRPRARLTIVHCSEYVRRSYSGNRFFRAYRHEVAISAGLIDARGGSLRPHVPRILSWSDPVRVGMVARLDPIKNHRLVIDAFRLILAKYPKAELEFVGDGVEMERLKARARELGINECVVFHGRVPDPVPVMREWDLFLYGTTGAEGFGAALAEAMCLGLPCVVTDIGPMREVGGDEGAVKYVSPDSPEEFSRAVVALLGDKNERNQMSARAHRRAATTFDGTLFAEKVAELLRLRTRPRSRRMASVTAA